MAAILKIVFLAITQQPIVRFSEILCEEAAFHGISVMGQTCPGVPQNVLFCFPNAVWASASGGFLYRLRFTCFVTDVPNLSDGRRLRHLTVAVANNDDSSTDYHTNRQTDLTFKILK